MIRSRFLVKVIVVLACCATFPALPGLAAKADSAASYAQEMAEHHRGDRPVPSPAVTENVPTDVSATSVSYARIDGKKVEGYLAVPKDAARDIPGIIVIHEWWGLNDNIRAMTRRLAALGLRALAVDLYQGEVATTPPAAQKLMRDSLENPDRAKSNLRQAYEYLRRKGSPRIGVIGWCFGGGWSLQTALLYPRDLAAAIIYYGRLVTDPATLKGLKVPIQGHFGALDTLNSKATIERFQKELEAQGTPVETYIYPGAGHAFANPSGTRYNAKAADAAWSRSVRFLRNHLIRPAR